VPLAAETAGTGYFALLLQVSQRPPYARQLRIGNRDDPAPRAAVEHRGGHLEGIEHRITGQRVEDGTLHPPGSTAHQAHYTKGYFVGAIGTLRRLDKTKRQTVRCASII